MIIIIKKNPGASLQAIEIEKLLNPLIKGRFWQKTGVLKSLRIIEINHPQFGFTEYQCICEVIPKEVTQRLITALNGKIAFGVPLIVQEYTVRNQHNEQRKQQLFNALSGKEQRSAERRRTHLVTRAVHKSS